MSIIESEVKRKLRQRLWSEIEGPRPSQGLYTEGELTEQVWIRVMKALDEVEPVLPDERMRITLRLLCAGERSTEVFAQAYGFNEQQRSKWPRMVKREKDRFRKHLDRNWDIQAFRGLLRANAWPGNSDEMSNFGG